MRESDLEVFDENGIGFFYHHSWTLTDKCWDNHISSLDFELGDDELCAIDIYHVAGAEAPTLSQYEKVHFESFIRELPFSFKLDDPLRKNTEKRSSLFGEVLGSRCEFVIRSCFVFKREHLIFTFRLESSNSVSFVSMYCYKKNRKKALKNFDILLNSYMVKS